ncbi:MAG: Hpt domain-containing protein, partial [Pseudomonas sp.]
MARPSSTPELTQDVLEDFRQETTEQFQRSEQLLIELERQPQDRARLRELFRLIHSIKGNMGYVGLHGLTPLPQALEDLLGRLREGSWTFDNLLGDILLLTLDRLRMLIDEALDGSATHLAPPDLAALCQNLQA